MTTLWTSKYLKILSSSLIVVALGVCHHVWKSLLQKETNPSNESKIDKDVTDETNLENTTKTEDEENNLEGKTPDITFDNIVGCSNVQEELKQYVEYLKNPQTFKDLKIYMRTGCLLVGPTNSGKRTIAHALAGAAKVKLLEISDAIPDSDGAFGHHLLCNSRKLGLKEIFEYARSHTQCVVFVNNMDTIMDTAKPIMQQFFHEMENNKMNDGIVFLAAVCEKPDGFEEKTMCRSGRFDNEVKLTRPNFQERKELFTLFLRDITHDNTLDVDILSRRTDGYQVGSIRRLLDRSMIRIITQHKSTVTMEDIEDLIDELEVGSAERKFVGDKESLKGTAYHEAGHALVQYYSDEQGFDPLYKVTIVKRGGTLGMTSLLPEPNKDFSRCRMISHMDTAFGGRVAEEMLFGKDRVTTGCGSDLQKASFIAELMVKDYSMSEKVGFRVYASDEIGFSEEIKKKIENEIDRLLHESYERVMSLLSKHKAELDLIANALLLKKTLYGDDVKELIEESLSTASGITLYQKKKDRDDSPNIVYKRTFSKTATGSIKEAS